MKEKTWDPIKLIKCAPGNQKGCMKDRHRSDDAVAAEWAVNPPPPPSDVGVRTLLQTVQFTSQQVSWPRRLRAQTTAPPLRSK